MEPNHFGSIFFCAQHVGIFNERSKADSSQDSAFEDSTKILETLTVALNSQPDSTDFGSQRITITPLKVEVGWCLEWPRKDRDTYEEDSCCRGFHCFCDF